MWFIVSLFLLLGMKVFSTHSRRHLMAISTKLSECPKLEKATKSSPSIEFCSPEVDWFTVVLNTAKKAQSRDRS
jgi:hypothetical protein